MSCAAVLLVRLAPPLPVLHPSKGGAIKVVPHPSTPETYAAFLILQICRGVGLSGRHVVKNSIGVFKHPPPPSPHRAICSCSEDSRAAFAKRRRARWAAGCA